MKTHMRDIRLFVNAGIHMPVCYAQKPLLDLEKQSLPTSSIQSDVSCAKCMRMFAKLYPWALSAKSREVLDEE